MEPMEINGGRFYVRPLHDDDRIDDRPALTRALGHQVPDDFVESARNDWLSNTAYTWASCEATWIDMAAFIKLTLAGDGTGTIESWVADDPDTLVPNPDDLERKTFQDAADEGVAAIRRWAAGFAGITITN